MYAASGGAAYVLTPRSLAQLPRSWLLIPYGLPEFSTERNADSACLGMRDSSRTRLRRISAILGTCSINTGHSLMQAPHMVHDHSVSSRMVPPTSGSWPGYSASILAEASARSASCTPARLLS